MSKDFEMRFDATVDATPEQVWDAIATGPGISSWFVGRTEIDGDRVRTAFGDDWIPTGTVTERDEPHRFAYRTDPAPDGRFLATEYLVEGRDHAATTIRTVISGFLPGDDWAGEYEAMQFGNQLFAASLAEYLQHVRRPVTPVTAFGPPVTDWPATWRRLYAALGISATSPGVYFVNPHTIGLRTANGLYRYLRGFHGTLVAAHALVTPDDTDWPAFLEKL